MAHERTEQKPADAGHDVDDDGPRRADDVGGRRPERSHPVHVEEDVQQPAVQPRRAQHRPPAAEPEHRKRAARAKQHEGARARRQNGEPAADDRQVAARGEQGQHVERARRADDERDESQDRRRAAGARARIPRIPGSRGRSCSTCRHAPRRAIPHDGQTTDPVVFRRSIRRRSYRVPGAARRVTSAPHANQPRGSVCSPGTVDISQLRLHNRLLCLSSIRVPSLRPSLRISLP